MLGLQVNQSSKGIARLRSGFVRASVRSREWAALVLQPVGWACGADGPNERHTSDPPFSAAQPAHKDVVLENNGLVVSRVTRFVVRSHCTDAAECPQGEGIQP